MKSLMVMRHICWEMTPPKRYRRLSLNPVRHVDVFGTLILPTLLILSKTGLVFGWAKPVPVDFSRLRNPRRDTLIVAAAGIITNIFLAALSALALHWVAGLDNSIGKKYCQSVFNQHGGF